MMGIGDGQVSEGVFTDEFDFVDENTNATRVSNYFAGRAAQSWSMFLQEHLRLVSTGVAKVESAQVDT